MYKVELPMRGWDSGWARMTSSRVTLNFLTCGSTLSSLLRGKPLHPSQSKRPLKPPQKGIFVLELEISP